MKQKMKARYPGAGVDEAVMERIGSGEITMKPRWHFWLGSGLMAAGLAGLGAGTVYLFNLILFLLRKHRPAGQWRLEEILDSFPWWIPVLAAAGVVAGIWLLKKYDFSYRKNFGLIVAGLIAAILLCAWIMDASGVNEVWSGRGTMKRFYQQLERPEHAPGNYQQRRLNWR